MRPVDFGQTPGSHKLMRAGGLIASVLFHVVLAKYALVDRPVDTKKDTWVEMTLNEPPPPPPPPPPPEPEPEPEPEPKPTPKPKPKKPLPPPEPVEFKETVKQPPPEQEVRRPVRRVQGLSSSSFSKGSGTGIQASAGTSMKVAATSERLTIDEAAESVPFAAATSQPRCKRPSMQVPDSLIEAEITGSVHIAFDVLNSGTVRNVRVVRPLHPDADAACIAAWSSVRCKPGKQAGDPVTVTNMPYICTFKAID